MEHATHSSLLRGESPDDRHTTAGRLFQRAEDLRGRGEAAAALEPYRSALDAFREVGDDLRAAETRYRIAWIDGRLGRRTAAAQLKAAAEELGRHARPERRLTALERAGGLLLGTGDARGAVDLLRSAARGAEEAGDRDRTVHVFARLGEAHHLLADEATAVAAYDRALAAHDLLEVADPAERSRLLVLAAAADRALGRLASARTRLEEVVELRRRTGVDEEAEGASVDLDSLLAELEKTEATRDFLEQAAVRLEDHNDRAGRIARARNALRLARHHHLLAWARYRPVALERSRRHLAVATRELRQAETSAAKSATRGADTADP